MYPVCKCHDSSPVARCCTSLKKPCVAACATADSEKSRPSSIPRADEKYEKSPQWPVLNPSFVLLAQIHHFRAGLSQFIESSTGPRLEPQDLRRYVDEPRYEEDFPHSNIRYPKYPCLWDAFLSHQSAHDSAHMPGPRPSSLPRPSLMISEWLGVQHGSILRVQFQVSLCCENHEMVPQFVLLSWLISREIP